MTQRWDERRPVQYIKRVEDIVVESESSGCVCGGGGGEKYGKYIVAFLYFTDHPLTSEAEIHYSRETRRR